MSKQKMLKARKLMQHQRYDEARKILKTVNHPTARAWMRKLDAVVPKKTGGRFTSAPTIYYLGGGVIGILLVVFLILVVVLISPNRNGEPPISAVSTPLPPPTATRTDLSRPTATLTPTFTLVPSATPGQPETPDPPCEAEGWHLQFTAYFDRFQALRDDASAANADLVSISSSLLALREEFGGFRYPRCAAIARQHFLNLLSETAAAYLDSVAGIPADQSQHAMNSLDEMESLNRELERLGLRQNG